MSSASLKQTHSKIGLILLAFAAFISLGLPDGLLGVAWPSMRADFSLPLDALGTLLVASMAGYLTSSFFSGWLMGRLGVGGMLWTCSLAAGAGLLGYTLVPAWWMLVLLGVVAGFGAGAIDAGLNTYIASQHGEGLMQWLHASFGIGVTLGPLIMTLSIQQFNSWRPGYVLVGAVKILLAVCFVLTAAMWKRTGPTKGEDIPLQRLMDYQTPLRETLHQRGAWLSSLLFFISTGLELTIGHWAFTLLTEGRGIALQTAGFWAGSYWATFTMGRVLAGLYAKKIGLNVLLRATLLTALVGAILVWWNPTETISLLGVALAGFAIAPVFPALVSTTAARVGMRHAANTIGMQISAGGLGAALLPGLAGILARHTSLEAIPAFLVVSFALLFGLFSLSLRQKIAVK